MPEIPKDTELASWHRYFAMENNNRAWELSGRARSSEEDQEMLNAAHAAALHWSSFGVELNDMRAKMLLAEVHAALSYGRSALALANEIKDYFLAHETPDWEIAFVHTIHAHAAFAQSDFEQHAASHAEAVRSIAAIAEDEDREIVLRLFEQVPDPR